MAMRSVAMAPFNFGKANWEPLAVWTGGVAAPVRGRI